MNSIGSVLRRYWWFVVVLAAATGATIYFTPGQVEYHRNAMDRAFQAQVEAQHDGRYDDSDRAYEEYERHRDALVEQGHLVHERVILLPRGDRDDETWDEAWRANHRHALDALENTYPDYPYWTVGVNLEETDMEYWVRPEDRDEWAQFAEGFKGVAQYPADDEKNSPSAD